MSTPPDAPPQTIEYENLLYILAEIERTIARGTIPGTVASAEAAHHRFAKLSAEMAGVASKLRIG